MQDFGPPMSALGHKQTYALHKVMSALLPIATAKADIGKPSCLLYPRKQICAVQLGMSALGQKRTSCHSFDHLIGAVEQRAGDVEAERFGRFEIDHQHVLVRRLHRQIGWLLALEDAVDVTGRAAVLVDDIGSVG